MDVRRRRGEELKREVRHPLFISVAGVSIFSKLGVTSSEFFCTQTSNRNHFFSPCVQSKEECSGAKEKQNK
jgi:hypothetical protein